MEEKYEVGDNVSYKTEDNEIKSGTIEDIKEEQEEHSTFTKTILTLEDGTEIRDWKVVDEDKLIKGWEENSLKGAKRVNINNNRSDIDDWFIGYGKDRSCQIEGNWTDWVNLALKILSSENTRQLVEEGSGFSEEIYQPELEKYVDDLGSYDYIPDE